MCRKHFGCSAFTPALSNQLCGLNSVTTNSREGLVLFHQKGSKVLFLRCWFIPALLVKETEAIIVGKPREFKVAPRI